MPYAHEPPPRAGAVPPPLDALAAPALPVGSDPLDELLGEAPPEHTWTGTALVWTLYASMAGTAGTLAYKATELPGDQVNLLSVLTLGPPFLLAQFLIARGIQKFSLSGYGLTMLLLAAMVVGGAETVVDADTLLDTLAGGAAACLGVGWIRYLLGRRSDFT